MVRRRRRVRRSSTLATSYASPAGGGMGGIASGGIIHIKRKMLVLRRRTNDFHMIYGEAPYYQPLSAVVTASPSHGNISFQTKIGVGSGGHGAASESMAQLGLQDLHMGQQDISNWPVASTVGLSREIHVFVRNNGMPAQVTIDFTVRLMSNLG